MKRIYWLLIAAVPVMLWLLSQGGSTQESPSKPDSDKPPAEKPKPAPETTPEATKDLPTSSNGSFPKPAPVVEVPASEEPAPVEEPALEAVVPPAAPAEKIAEAAELAPPSAPQIEVSAPESAAEGELIQLFDSKERSQEGRLLEITGLQAYVRCDSLPEKEKVRLVLPFGEAALTVNGQLLSVEEGVSRFKILTMKAGQKKRFEEYLAQRSTR